MAETVTASEAARMLQVDPKTLRKRLQRQYRGPERIKGAVKNGRDWQIPRSEIKRLVDLKIDTSLASIEGAEAFVFAESALESARGDAFNRLLDAASGLISASDGKGGNMFDALLELRKAVKAHEEIAEGGSAVLQGVAAIVMQHVKGREFLEEQGYP